jgi:hypothetical protein
MRAALPFVDDFLASHSLASLQQLAVYLQQVDDHRPERGSGTVSRRSSSVNGFQVS